MATARTTETLRSLLFDAIEAVRAGTMDTNKAKSIALLAEKMIATADLELRYSEVVSKLDKDDQGITPGPLLLTGKVEPKVIEPVGVKVTRNSTAEAA